MTARLANGRKAIVPRLVKSVGGVEQPSGAAVDDLPFPQERMRIVLDGMRAVANDVTGTAYRNSQLGLGDVKMAGKTGTAQARTYRAGESRGPKNEEWSKRDHAWFVAFAPYDQPRYAMSVLVQHAPYGGSADAAPRAREIMRVALLKDPEILARVQEPLPLPKIDPFAEDVGAAPEPPTAT